MKTFRILTITSLVLLNLSNTCITAGNAEGISLGNAILTDVSSANKTLISTQQSLQDFKLYLNKQIAKRHLTLSPEQIEALIAKSRSLIYENSREGKISQSDSRKIQKNFKLYLKTTYPENFKINRSKNEVNYKLARRRIRATTKDFIVNTLQINNNQAKNNNAVQEYWDKVKGLVYKKLDKAAYFNDFNELVVDESAISEIIGKVFNKLELENANNDKNSTVNTNDPNNPKRKRKAVVPEKISAPIAEKLVRLMIRNKGINAKHNETLTNKIMKDINKKLKRGRVEKDFVIQITKQEIDEFLDLKNNINKKSSERYLDRFIKAMGNVPETNH